MFDGVAAREGPNFVADRATFLIEEDGARYALHPEKRRYLARDMVMTEAAIDRGWTRDIYVALGEPLGDGACRAAQPIKCQFSRCFQSRHALDKACNSHWQ